MAARPASAGAIPQTWIGHQITIDIPHMRIEVTGPLRAITPVVDRVTLEIGTDTGHPIQVIVPADYPIART